MYRYVRSWKNICKTALIKCLLHEGWNENVIKWPYLNFRAKMTKTSFIAIFGAKIQITHYLSNQLRLECWKWDFFDWFSTTVHFWFFLAWLEASFQEELDPGNVQHEEHARNLVVQLVQQLESKAVESGDFLTKNKLEEIISSIKVSKVITNYTGCPKKCKNHITQL